MEIVAWVKAKIADNLKNICPLVADVLQHWNQIERHYGNYMLDRVDPLIWEINDPWKDLHFQVSFMLSKRAMAAIDKQYGATIAMSLL